MSSLLATLVLTLGLGTAVAADKVPEWTVLGASQAFSVEIDLNSLDAKYVENDWQIASRIRVVFFESFQTKDKKIAAYSISNTVAMCKQDKLVFQSSTLHDKNGTVIDTGQGGTAANPHMDGNFVSIFLQLMCSKAKNLKPPRST